MAVTENLKDSFIKVISERVSNPFLVGFCISWVVVNFRFFVALFKQSGYENFSKIVESTIFTSDIYEFAFFDCPQWLYFGILVPSMLSLTYILLSPYLVLLIYNYQNWHEEKKRHWINFWDQKFVATRSDWNDLKLQNRNYLESINSLEEKYALIIGLNMQLTEEKKNLSGLVDSLGRELDDFKSLKPAVDEEKVESSTSNDSVFDQPHVRKLFSFMVASGGRYDKKTMGINGMTEIQIKDALAKLIDAGLIKINGMSGHRLTNTGLDLAVRLEK